MRLVQLLPVWMCAAALALSGCGDSQPPQQSKAPAAAQQAAQSAPRHRVLDSFNVGDGVYVRSLAIEPKTGSLWVGTSVGVLEVGLQDQQLRNTYTREQGLANEFVFAIFVDSRGNKWFGTDGGGVSRLNPAGKWDTFMPMHGLADYWVYSFAEQTNGTLWVGTWAGLNSIDPKTEKFSLYFKELVNEWVYGLDIDDQQRVWIGTEGGVNMFDGKAWSTWTHENGLGASNVEGLPPSTNTGLGTRSRHDLSTMQSGMPTYNPNYVFDILAAKDQTIWAGTWGGGAAHFINGKWENFTTREGLAGNIVFSIAQDQEGRLWFGTNQGLASFDGRHWDRYTKLDGLLDDAVYDVVVSADGSVWVGTRNGVARIGR